MESKMNVIAQGPDPEGLAITVDKIIHALANMQPGDPFFFMAMPRHSDKVQFIGAMSTEDFLVALDVLQVAIEGVHQANGMANNQETMQ